MARVNNNGNGDGFLATYPYGVILFSGQFYNKTYGWIGASPEAAYSDLLAFVDSVKDIKAQIAGINNRRASLGGGEIDDDAPVPDVILDSYDEWLNVVDNLIIAHGHKVIPEDIRIAVNDVRVNAFGRPPIEFGADPSMIVLNN